jgi:lysophospholipase
VKINTIRDKSNSLDLRYGLSEGSDRASRFLVLANGRSEWVEKYEGLASDLNVGADTGYMTFDHRGQGASGGARAWIDTYDSFASDMAQMVNHSINGKPFNLICHSMGGLISLVAIMNGLIKPRCVVLSSALFGLPNKPIPLPLGLNAAKLLTKLHLGHINTGLGGYWKKDFPLNILTHSPQRFLAIQNTPYPCPTATFEWVKASYEATQFIQRPENLAKLTMPILVLSGTDEKVVDPLATQRWVVAASKHAKAGVDFHRIQGGYHELLFESRPIYESVLALINGWFDKKGFPL